MSKVRAQTMSGCEMTGIWSLGLYQIPPKSIEVGSTNSALVCQKLLLNITQLSF